MARSANPVHAIRPMRGAMNALRVASTSVACAAIGGSVACTISQA
ncbi:MAG: hypothetical protein U0176_13770 [Bacteroidia bacterium]